MPSSGFAIFLKNGCKTRGRALPMEYCSRVDRRHSVPIFVVFCVMLFILETKSTSALERCFGVER